MKGIEKHIFGPGCTVINYEDGHGKPLFSTEEYTRIVNTLSAQAKYNRGEFISKCSEVDYVLGIAISWFFFEADNEKTKIFSELILRTGFFSFTQKKKVLESLIKNYPVRYPTVKEKKQGISPKINERD
jgi:hypothetical protein